MEDKKRQKEAGENRPNEPPAKKQVFEEDVAGFEAEIERFQKEAIWRRLQEYKREATRAKKRVEELERVVERQGGHLAAMDAWVDEFLNEIYIYSGLKGTLEGGGVGEKSFPGLLFESDASFRAYLGEKKGKIMNIAESVLNMVRSGCVGDAETERIKNYAARVSSELTIAKSYIKQLKMERETDEKKMEDLFYELVSLEKKIDREKSVTLSRIRSNAMRRPVEVGTQVVSVEVTKRSKLEENKPGEGVEAMDAKLREMEAVNEKRQAEISKLNSQNAELHEQLLSLQLKLKNPSEEEIVNSDVYYSLKSKYELCAAKIKKMEPAYDSVSKEVEKLRLERLEFKEELLNEQKNIIADMRDQLSKVEQDLARVRTVRDELLSQLNIKKATESSNSAAKKELMELLETRNTRITALEEQLQRLNNHIEQSYELGNEVNLEKSKEELVKQIERLEKQNKSLSSELLTLEQAFNKAHHQSSLKVNEIIAKEDKFYRLNADKAKADQKYFDAMKAKDKLTIENKALKQQNSKAGDIIIKLQETEKITMQKLIILEKQIAILRPANETLISKVHELESKVEEKDHNIKNIGQQVSMLKQRLLEQENITNTEINSKRIAEEKIEKLKIQIQKNKNQNTVNGDIDELKVYKSMAKCSVCETKWKNTAISLCGHVFCKECINKRIETRQRRCPSCNRGFGSGDILQVHL
ncbi:hypothetical protein MERGE_002464 [Pneumocystis wakefieldiae]|uniref:E3 ubiquitin protein ligase n=1 Tax=Pneumocystis wakefieldiae TaxID=38082 RepID=A0A899G0Z5_9ASCO|nr:hypothetical protein MERGE_002464 [Pneumocystis wakefieldiae]